MSKMETITINDVQQEIYNDEEIKRMENYFRIYNQTICEMKEKNCITILDIGSGGGYFARYIKKRLKETDSECTNFQIFAIDNIKYDAWDTEDENIEYILCDAVDLCSVFEKEMFDYVFCNMFAHHLVGNNYKESAAIRKIVFDGIADILKRNGKLLITDNFNDGFLFDSSSCRIVFALTTCQNPILKCFIFKLGAHSAGSGVCMMSERMWEELLMDCGFEILVKNCAKPDKWSLIKRVLLLNRSYRQECLMEVCLKEQAG